MSNLKVTNILSNGTGFNDVVSFQNASGTQNGTLCRAWVNFDGTGTVAIRAQFNVSSITDNGTGKYTVNFSNSFSDANYAVTLSVGNDSGNSGNGSWITRNEGNGTGACGPFRFSRPDTNAQVDASVIGIAVFR
jgi:hypothetical protein